MRPGATEAQAHKDKLGVRNRWWGKVTQKGKEASATEAFISGGETGSCQQAQTSASMAEIEVVRRQQRRAVRRARPLSWGR
jgi:hypothetical protein